MNWATLLAAPLLFVSFSAQALEAVATTNRDGAAGTLDEAGLRALPTNSLPVTFATGSGVERARWTGALLWDVVGKIGLPEKGRLTLSIVVTGKDGYAVTFSLGEIDPDLGGEPVILAWARDGADLSADSGPRLVIPGDKRGARAVRDVARIELH